jgi:hypothetical protein
LGGKEADRGSGGNGQEDGKSLHPRHFSSRLSAIGYRLSAIGYQREAERERCESRKR